MEKVLIVDDEQDALRAIGDSRPEVVITDMMMPVMSGPELVRHLRNNPDLAGIFIVCVSGDEDLAVGADLAFDKFKDLSGLVASGEALVDQGRGPR